jgi:hypothetical protein
MMSLKKRHVVVQCTYGLLNLLLEHQSAAEPGSYGSEMNLKKDFFEKMIKKIGRFLNKNAQFKNIKSFFPYKIFPFFPKKFISRHNMQLNTHNT